LGGAGGVGAGGAQGGTGGGNGIENPMAIVREMKKFQKP
jgi:hypothetical protein